MTQEWTVPSGVSQFEELITEILKKTINGMTARLKPVLVTGKNTWRDVKKQHQITYRQAEKVSFNLAIVILASLELLRPETAYWLLSRCEKWTLFIFRIDVDFSKTSHLGQTCLPITVTVQYKLKRLTVTAVWSEHFASEHFEFSWNDFVCIWCLVNGSLILLT